MKNPLRRLRAESKVFATITCALLVAAAPARALDLVLVYDDLGENPGWDRNGTALMAVAQAAAARWERLIPSPGTHIIDVSWSDLGTNHLGLWKFDSFGNNNIYFDSNASWFVDPTASSDTEFDFGDALDFSGRGSQLAGPNPSSLWFDGANPPTMFEVARYGIGTSGAAAGDYDLLSVVLHEMGHELGVAGDEFSGRYPIYPAHLLGISGVEVIEANLEGDEGYGEEHGHVAPPEALMSPNLQRGKRVLPSALDVLVAARDSNYTSVDLLRKFTGRSGDWGDATDWIGDRVPDADDAVFIAHGGTTTLTGARTADSVSIDGNTLLNATGDLVIDRELRLGGTGRLRANNLGSEIRAQSLDARALSEIEILGGQLVVAGGTLAKDATLFGHGTLEVNGTLHVGGLIDSIGDVRIDGTGSLQLLDASGDASTVVLRARTGNLGLAIGFGSTSRGVIEVTGGHNLTALEDVTIPANVTVQLHEPSGGPAILNSIGTDVDLTIHNLLVGEINGVPATAQVSARTLTLEDDAEVHGTLTLASPVLTTLRGGLRMDDSTSGNGDVVQAGDLSVQGGEVTFSLRTFDWGNSTSAKTNSLNIGLNAELMIFASSLGSRTNAFRGNIQIDSGVLHVNFNLPWELPAPSGTAPGGMLSMLHNGTADPIVRGAPFTVCDYLIVSGGDAFIEADLTVAPTGKVVAFGSSASLFLDGDTTLNGGSCTGLGSLIQRGDINVTGNTTIAVNEFAWGNSFGLDFHTLTVHRGATLTINSPGTGDPDNQFRGLVRLEGGDLVINTDTGWTLPASGLLQIPGTLQLHNNGTTPHLRGQPVTIGAGCTVTGGAAHIGSDASFLATSQTDIAAGATLHLNGSTTYRGTFTGAGTLQHNGSALHTSGTPLTIPHLVQHGLFTMFALSGESNLLTHTLVFASGSETRLSSDLRITGIASVTTGATFNGSGTLIVTERLSGIGLVGVDVRNEGTVHPGVGAGLLSIGGDYIQTGTLDVEIGGTAVNAFDRLSITGTAALSGGVNVSLIGGFAPVPGQTFQILTAPGGVSGGFTTLSQPAGMPAGFAFSISYSASAVTLAVVAAPPYESWINSFGAITDPAAKTRDANPDNDGLNNRAEFALDGNPASGLATGKVVSKITRVGDTEALTLTLPIRANAQPATGEPSGGEFVLRQSADAVTYTIQASGDVVKWTVDVTEVTGPDAANIQLGLPVLNRGWVYRTFCSPGPVASETRGFIRAMISD